MGVAVHHDVGVRGAMTFYAVNNRNEWGGCYTWRLCTIVPVLSLNAEVLRGLAGGGVAVSTSKWSLLDSSNDRFDFPANRDSRLAILDLYCWLVDINDTGWIMALAHPHSLLLKQVHLMHG